MPARSAMTKFTYSGARTPTSTFIAMQIQHGYGFHSDDKRDQGEEERGGQGDGVVLERQCRQEEHPDRFWLVLFQRSGYPAQLHLRTEGGSRQGPRSMILHLLALSIPAYLLCPTISFELVKL